MGSFIRASDHEHSARAHVVAGSDVIRGLGFFFWTLEGTYIWHVSHIFLLYTLGGGEASDRQVSLLIAVLIFYLT